MKKTFFAVTLIVSAFVLFSCNQGKITEYEKLIEALNSQISSLQGENSLLQEEIGTLRKEIEAYNLTDQYYYQSGADEFINKKYENAISWMTKLKIKFPISSLIVHADKIINDSNSELFELRKAFKALYPEYSDDVRTLNALSALRRGHIPVGFPKDDRARKLGALGVPSNVTSHLLQEDGITLFEWSEN